MLLHKTVPIVDLCKSSSKRRPNHVSNIKSPLIRSLRSTFREFQFRLSLEGLKLFWFNCDVQKHTSHVTSHVTTKSEFLHESWQMGRIDAIAVYRTKVLWCSHVFDVRVEAVDVAGVLH